MPTPQGNQSHSYQGKELFFEFFRYLTGQTVYNAHNGYTDYATDNKYNLNEEDPALIWDQTAISWDTEIEEKVPPGQRLAPNYISPIDPLSLIHISEPTRL